MNRRQIALKLVLDDLGLLPTMDSFDQRLTLQKTIYLAQQMGVPLGYHFSWYLRGPYSKDLTADAYTNLNASTPEGWSIEGPAKAAIGKVKPLLIEAHKKDNPVRELEKLASVLFVVRTGQASDHDTETLTSRLKSAGKDFAQCEVDGAVQTLRANGLLN